jgi:hypothetical protein
MDDLDKDEKIIFKEIGCEDADWTNRLGVVSNDEFLQTWK